MLLLSVALPADDPEFQLGTAMAFPLVPSVVGFVFTALLCGLVARRVARS